jgi:hypothetical protein
MSIAAKYNKKARNSFLTAKARRSPRLIVALRDLRAFAVNNQEIR